jgi:hypothetical protein
MMIEFFQGRGAMEITITIHDELARQIIPEDLDPSRQACNELGHLWRHYIGHGARLLTMPEHPRKGIETHDLEQQWTLWNSQLPRVRAD